MKDWYNRALDELRNKLEEENKVSGLAFLEDFVLEFREQYFENLEFEDIDNFVSSEFDEFQSWLCSKPVKAIISKNGKWNLFTEEKEKTLNQELFDDLILEERENELLHLDPFSLSSDLIEEFKKLYSKLSSTNHNRLKFNCAYRLATCAELNRNIHENDYIRFWLEASDMAALASRSIDGCDCKEKAAYYSLRISKHNDAARYFEEAYNLIEDKEYGKKKHQLLRNCRIQYQIDGDHDNASRIFIREKKLEAKEAGKRKKVALWLYWLTSNYGESPTKVIYNAAAVLFISTLLSLFLKVTGSGQGGLSDFADSAYYSVVTFTTLGYGDYYPTSYPGKLLAAVVAILGLIYSSLFMVAVVRKYSRS